MATYFTHDSNARNSKKLLRLRMAHGAEGYGVYFMLLERLREEEGYVSDKDYDMLAFDLRCDPKIVRSVIENFDLFIISEDGTKFKSKGFDERMDIKDKRSEAGKKGASARWEDTPDRMAQNGKFMANDGKNEICHDFAKREEDKERSKEKEVEKEIKEKKSKENYYSSSILPFDFVTEESEEEEKQQQEFFNISEFFFFKNFSDPDEQARLFRNWNNTGGRKWRALDFEQKEAALDSWEQKPSKADRTPKTFIKLWKDMLGALASIGGGEQAARYFLDPRITLSKEDRVTYLVCTSWVRVCIEQNLDTFRPIITNHLKHFCGYKEIDMPELTQN